MMPATAWTRPSPSSTPAPADQSASASLAAMPSSMALPIDDGISACASIQTIASTIPPASGTLRDASHTRYRVADRWSGVPGSATGKVRIAPRSYVINWPIATDFPVLGRRDGP